MMRGIVIPDELQPYLEYADPNRFDEWKKHNSMRVFPRWDRDAKTLSIGDRMIKKFRAYSRNQFRILDALEEAHWPRTVKNPLRDATQLGQTVVDFNKSLEGSDGFRLVAEADRLRWRFRSEGLSLP